MSSVEDLLQQLVNVYSHLSEASPPPFKAADRAQAGMKPLPTRKGAQPPPIPKAKPKVLAIGKTKAVVHSPTPKGNKGLGIKRSFSMHTAQGAASEPHAAKAIGWAKEKVAARAAKGESLRHTAAELRGLLD